MRDSNDWLGNRLMDLLDSKDFLMDLVKNLGRGEISTTSLIAKKIFQAWRTVTNFNLPGKSKKNVVEPNEILENYGSPIRISQEIQEVESA